MVSITINGREVEVEEDQTILEVARAEGIGIPTFCSHEELKPYGACRMCVVEIKESSSGVEGLEPACQYRVEPDLVVETNTDRVKSARKVICELLLARAPDNERLQQQANVLDIDEPRVKLEEVEEEKCILCGLCVRVCDEIVKQNAIGFYGRGIEKRVETPFEKISETCIGCGACAYLCPTDTIVIEEAF